MQDNKTIRILRIPQACMFGSLLFLLHIDVIPQALSDSHTYLDVDEARIFSQYKDVTEIENVLNKEFANMCE